MKCRISRGGDMIISDISYFRLIFDLTVIAVAPKIIKY